MSRYKWVIVMVVGAMLAASLMMTIANRMESVPALASPNGLPVIVIDPGHGGLDGGAVGVDNIVEKNINLQISLMLRDIFTVNGFQVVMTRSEDISIHDESVKGTRKQKTSDLHNRLKLAGQYPNAILLSVHQNKFQDKRSNGTQVFFSPNNQNSERLAQILQADYIQTLQPENTRAHKVAGKNLFLMTEATCPAVLVECGFLSNSDDAYKLIDSEYQAQFAFTTFRGVMHFLELDQPVTTAVDLYQLSKWPVQRPFTRK